MLVVLERMRIFYKLWMLLKSVETILDAADMNVRATFTYPASANNTAFVRASAP